jgi:hypothetical protein
LSNAILALLIANELIEIFEQFLFVYTKKLSDALSHWPTDWGLPILNLVEITIRHPKVSRKKPALNAGLLKQSPNLRGFLPLN